MRVMCMKFLLKYFWKCYYNHLPSLYPPFKKFLPWSYKWSDCIYFVCLYFRIWKSAKLKRFFAFFLIQESETRSYQNNLTGRDYLLVLCLNTTQSNVENKPNTTSLYYIKNNYLQQQKVTKMLGAFFSFIFKQKCSLSIF